MDEALLYNEVFEMILRGLERKLRRKKERRNNRLITSLITCALTSSSLHHTFVDGLCHHEELIR